MSGTIRPKRHLLVAGMSFADVESALSLARLIVERLPATPSGLLVETQFANLVTGERHRIVAAGGLLREIPSIEQLKRITSGEARMLKALLAGLAAGGSAPGTFDVAEGDLVTCACAALGEEDVLLLCQRRILRLRGSVLLLGAASLHSETSLAVAQALARANAAILQEIPLSDDVDEAAVFALVDRSPATAIIVDLNIGPIRTEEGLRRLVSAARCPVVVIGANRTRQSVADTQSGAAGKFAT
ncbi:hypothetical protein [Ruegeria marina]|uniref:Uncharacterized protein n=1 Tax=Ruegeria marina TaxID=639004 RepID=A0A1G6KVM7_9RHOB|nr:hypothetical protein [Ruegeria marina]SDC34993.1 hypothetical protein SAMN04488239_10265 [Ruegeria marina]